ncbi:MAG TPA: sulfurtransferase [Dehalococcoidia bacterium]|nr:sulfurtransferase [Dehalococcoidia bacterium]
MASDVLVSTDWVAQNLDNPKVKLVEVDVDTAAYDEGHIPGAVGFNWTSQLQDQVRRDIITREGLEQLLSEAGISNDDTIVLYGDNNNWFAAYAFWLLEMYGHQDLKLMDGGRKKWLDENRPLTKDLPKPQKTAYKAKEPNTALRARRDEVLRALGDAKKALVDVRSPAEYNGEIMAPPGLPETAQRMGHIPGAANVPWAQAVREDGTFKSPEELEQLYASKGIARDKDVIAYCRIGERSSHTWFALKHLLGYPNVKNYDGSWTEYGSLIDVPIEK